MHISVNLPLQKNEAGPAQGSQAEPAADLRLRMKVYNLNFYYGGKQALFGINLWIAANRVTGLIGPSGFGKSTLLRAPLWDEVKDQLHKSAYGLSGGQQQRLCIARALAVDPEVLLLDEPCSALDPVNTAKIEELLFRLKEKWTIVIVTHNMQQAARVSDFTAFLLNGQLVEFSPTSQLFTTPADARTEAYITGRFG